MKKEVLAFILVICFNNAWSQWITLNSGSAVTMQQVFFPNDTIGYLLSYSDGKIFKTTNGGMNWTYKSTTNCTAIHFISPDTGFAGDGNQGTGIYKTVNGGLTWNHVASTGDYVTSFSFIKNVGYASAVISNGDSLVIYKTIDRGQSWNRLSATGDLLLVSPYLFFTDPSTGYFADMVMGIFKTTNGGLNWTKQYEDTSIFSIRWVQSLNFPAHDTGFAYGFTILKTTDGGLHWSEIDQSVSTGEFFSSYFLSTQRGFIVSGSGTIIETNDGGQIWNLVINTTIPFRSVFFPSPDLGFACGNNGQLLKYTNPLSIKEKASKDIMVAFPNPSSTGEFYLNTQSNKNKRITVLSSMGQKVYEIKDTLDATIELDLSQHSKGLYFVTIESEGKTEMAKIVFF